MPYKDPENHKKWSKEYYQLNKEKIKEFMKEYNKTEEGHKSQKIGHWKYQGMILQKNQDWESIYYYVVSLDNCEECNKYFKNTRDRHLDHDHQTGFIRNVVCCSCNQKRRVLDREFK